MNKILISIFGLSALAIQLNAQNAVVSGRVIDQTSNEPLPFANVVVKGTKTGATTDFDGEFTIAGINPGFVTLEATYVGYKNAVSDEIQLTNAKTEYVIISMENAGIALQEVEVKANPFVRTEESPLSLQKMELAK